MVFLSSLVSALSYEIVRSSIVGVEDVSCATFLSAIVSSYEGITRPVYWVQVEGIEIMSLSVAFMSKKSIQFISRNPHSLAIEGLPDSVVEIVGLQVNTVIVLVYGNQYHNQVI